MGKFMKLMMLAFIIIQCLISVSSEPTITLLNNCNHTVLPGILSNAGSAPFQSTGFALPKGESKVLNVPYSWSGRLWACRSGEIECANPRNTPPATLAEFNFNEDGVICLYRLCVSEGFNIAMELSPIGGSGGNCKPTVCIVDLIVSCPSKLKVKNSDGEGIACKSSCKAHKRGKYCCRGAYGTRDNNCKPSPYSELFKNACPQAYNCAYDDDTTTFECTGANFQVTFCPSTTRPIHKHSPADVGFKPGTPGDTRTVYAKGKGSIPLWGIIIIILVVGGLAIVVRCYVCNRQTRTGNIIQIGSARNQRWTTNSGSGNTILQQAWNTKKQV